jgi:hypothetical protein
MEFLDRGLGARYHAGALQHSSGETRKGGWMTSRISPAPSDAPQSPPLYLGTISTDSLQAAPVFLAANGQVTWGDGFHWKGKNYYARQYVFCVEFLTRKGLPADVSRFREKGLMDVIKEMGASITRAELLEVADQNNQIAMIKEAILRDTMSVLHRKLHPRRRPSTESRTLRKR